MAKSSARCLAEVDSSVAAALIHRAIGDRLTCIFVDNGLMRFGEAERVRTVFASQLGVNLRFVDGTERFLAALKDVVDPEEKRRRIGEEFIRIFEEEARDIGEVDFLAQGTLYPDVIESVSPESTAAHKIKNAPQCRRIAGKDGLEPRRAAAAHV